jgi:hypothetical protein
MAKFPTRRETQEWRKKLVRELAHEFPDLRDEERFKAVLGQRVENDPEGRTMVYAVFLEAVMSEMEEEQRTKAKPGSRTAKAKRAAPKKKTIKVRGRAITLEDRSGRAAAKKKAAKKK